VRSIALLIARLACNNHTICDDELRPIGVGIYPLAALVNHDCGPNCVQTFAGRVIVFRCAHRSCLEAGLEGVLLLFDWGMRWLAPHTVGQKS
jgi:SET and MYND domain-containing protein